jgi:hypothetical protein
MVHPTFAEGLQMAIMKLPRFTLAKPAAGSTTSAE